VARPREFDETDVLDRALNAFWARGYDATSIEDLVEATGLGRASLYGAFGDKEQLFQRALARYVEYSRVERNRVTQDLSARHALEAFLNSLIVAAADKRKPSGCFLQLSATAGTTPPLVQEAFRATNREMNGWFTENLRQAQEQGELSPDADLAALTTFIGVFMSGLTASAKAGVSSKALTMAAREAIDLMFKESQSRKPPKPGK